MLGKCKLSKMQVILRACGAGLTVAGAHADPPSITRGTVNQVGAGLAFRLSRSHGYLSKKVRHSNLYDLA